MIKELNCSCICKEDVIIAVVDQVKNPYPEWQIALIIIITILTVLSIIIGFNKVNDENELQTVFCRMMLRRDDQVLTLNDMSGTDAK